MPRRHFAWALIGRTSAARLRATVPRVAHRRGVWSYRRLTVINGGTIFRDHDPCISLVDLVRAEVTYIELHGGSRVGGKETVPLPPPRGAR